MSTPFENPYKACAVLAEKYQAFGILSEDTNFLMFRMSPSIQIYSTNHLNLETLETIKYDRLKLVNGINMNQFPLLASLKGTSSGPSSPR